MVDAAALTNAITAAGCPVQGVSIGDPADRSTWVVQFGPGVTDAQRQAAAGVIAGWTDPATVTGNQWAFALNSLGLASAWRIGVTKSKDGDQNRILLIARDTPLVASDPLLARVASNAGNDANGNPLIVVATVFSTAQGMPL